MFSERKLEQPCAGFRDHCVNGTACDPDLNICTATANTIVSKCCLYAIPGVLSIPFLRLCPTLSRSPFASFCLYLFTCPYLFCHFVQLLQRLPSLSIHLFPETLSGVPRMQKSRSPCAENPALPKTHSFKSDSATVEVGMLRLMPRVLPSYSFIAVFSVYSA